jgi:tetraacyldisaccharide 4'-kinase
LEEGASVEDVGDEAALALRRLEGLGVVVAVGRDRVMAVQKVEQRGAQFIVLDDGFSHLRLRRDVDLVLVCPEDLAPKTRLLPTGPLREPPGSLSRAHLVAGLAQDWAGVPGAPRVLFDVRPVSLLDRQWRCLDLAVLAGRKVLLASGIARPERFAQTAKQAGMVPVGHRAFPDHCSPNAVTVKNLVDQARQLGVEAIVWTEKDWPRLPTIDFPCMALRIEMSPTKGIDLLMQAVLSSYLS